MNVCIHIQVGTETVNSQRIRARPAPQRRRIAPLAEVEQPDLHVVFLPREVARVEATVLDRLLNIQFLLVFFGDTPAS
jgi:hypothetical protein